MRFQQYTNVSTRLCSFILFWLEAVVLGMKDVNESSKQSIAGRGEAPQDRLGSSNRRVQVWLQPGIRLEFERVYHCYELTAFQKLK